MSWFEYDKFLSIRGPIRSFKLSASFHMTSGVHSGVDSANNDGAKNPDLRRAASNHSGRKILAAVVVAAALIYPMIFRPMFGFIGSGNRDSDDYSKVKNEIGKHRPSNMPEWSSPFGPKPGQE